MVSRRHPLFGTPLPADWQLLTVDDIKSTEKWSCVAGPFGSSISSKFFTETGVPVIRGANLRDDLTRFVPKGFVFVSEEQAEKYRPQHVRGGDLVFTCWGTLGQVGLIPRDGPFPVYIISNKQLKLRLNLVIADPLYAFYYFASPAMVQHILGKAVGAAVPGINLGILKGLPVVVPPLPIQRRIASILGAYDDLIEVNRRRVALMEEMARRLFNEKIARAVGGLPEPSGACVQSRELPSGWTVKPLAAVAQITMGQAPPSAELNVEGAGLVFHQGVSDFGELFPGRRVFSEHLTGKRIADEGDILFSVRAPVGRINCALERTVLGRGLAAVQCRGGERAYLLAHLRATFHTTDLIGNGAIYRAVNRSDLERVPIVCAPPEIRAVINKQLEDILAAVRTAYSTNRALAASRDLLLPRLISGELSLISAERELEAVV
jgi:type I restriction enzyme S subunit